jgi:hypothetical protein
MNESMEAVILGRRTPVPKSMPAQYKDLGKKAKDLFKKQYDFKNEIKVTSKSSGVKIESGASAGFVGHSKANWDDEFLGAIEVEAHSSGVAKGKFTKKGVADGVDVTVNGDAKGEIGVEATYSMDMLAATAKATHNLEKGSTALMASATVGMGDITAGGQVDLDAAGSLKDYQVGLQYSTKDLIAALSSSKFENVDIHVYHNMCSSTTVGANASIQGADKYTLGLGCDHSIGKGLGVKAKADSNGGVAIALTHTLAEPKMKVGMSAQYNALGDKPFQASKFGISLNLGEF